ncbi:hypothetical protein DAPPUDRAFT_238370 [Daphnia pulex]|uniref:Uncharacterized protein n=1 Tax=Daphnia pulex TaxID=6669 RepID=E9G683_DAPPU|nr:hypothetical protein DAPPUDRAFT_238370 [Daphnia pulex]|eukprot:EFX85036.1 hypothetical protein DAPPUDRAFT_238370 [Daphnia pulex]
MERSAYCIEYLAIHFLHWTDRNRWEEKKGKSRFIVSNAFSGSESSSEDGRKSLDAGVMEMQPVLFGKSVFASDGRAVSTSAAPGGPSTPTNIGGL